MAKYDESAIEANAKLRERHGNTREVKLAIRQAVYIRSISESGMDYPAILNKLYNERKGVRLNGKQKIS